MTLFLSVLISILLAHAFTTVLSAQLSSSSHSDNWAVIVSTSKYFFNYRHNADALSLYRTIKSLGIPDSNIILMLPEDVACTAKNVVPGTVYNSANAFSSRQKGLYNHPDYDKNHDPNNLYDENSMEIDYKGDDVTVENFLRVLTNRHHPTTTRNKRLATNANSNLFIYLSGHGGDQFLKFRDTEVLTSQDLAFAMQQLHAQQRFREAFLIVETCQAATMVELITTPNVITSASSVRGQNSYSHGVDHELGLSVIDKYTYYLHEFYSRTSRFQGVSMNSLLHSFGYKELRSTHHIRTELYEYDQSGQKIRDVTKVPVLDFFGATLSSVPTTFSFPMSFKWDYLNTPNLSTDSPSLQLHRALMDEILNDAVGNESDPRQSVNQLNPGNSTTNTPHNHAVTKSNIQSLKANIIQQHNDLRESYTNISHFLPIIYALFPFCYILSVLLVGYQIHASLFSQSQAESDKSA
jgi:phosphatidylinositol glycan class K